MEVTEPAADVRAESCNMKLHAVFILFDNKPQSRRNTREIEVVSYFLTVCFGAMAPKDDNSEESVKLVLSTEPTPEATSHAVFLDAGKSFGRWRRVFFSVACFALFWFYFFVLFSCWNRVPAVSYNSAPSSSHTPLCVASSSLGSLRLTASPVSCRLTVSSPVHLHVTTHPLRMRRSAKALYTSSARLSETAEPTFEFQSEPPLLTAINVHHIPPLDAAPFCKSITTKSTHPGGRLARSGGFMQLNPDRFLDLSFRNVAIGVWFSSGLDESYVSRYGNIGVHFLSWSLVCTPSWLIFRNIASPLPRRLCIPIPFESRWYSTDTCFGLNQDYLWSLNLQIVINLSHYSFSEASCLRVFISSHFVTGAIRFQGLSYLFVSAKSRTFILSGSVEIYLVSSWNLDVGARAVHARSRSFQTLPFGIINIHLMLPTVLQWMSKTLLFSFVITCFMFCFMMFIKPSRIPPVLILLPLSLAPNVMV
ncbi:hypothetical protein Bca52824_072687 [Brassica carinata]|uniref:Uncharacterized protein n=1 Tax=Brassica carinata TaxID=52824 RepID=A0A8X7QCK5_BRACI|nr:hypothetical protein Bca52824_072687 [Brassica carinata]